MADELSHVDELRRRPHGRRLRQGRHGPHGHGARAASRSRAEVVELLRGEGVPKGDALAVARIAGIMAAKRTPDLIPLCHPLAIGGVEVDLEVAEDGAVEITATVRTTDRTGVEMEALTVRHASPRSPSIDMVKAVDKHARITDIEVVAKSGGRSGDWTRAVKGAVVVASEPGVDRRLRGHHRAAARRRARRVGLRDRRHRSSSPTASRSARPCVPRSTTASTSS